MCIVSDNNNFAHGNPLVRTLKQHFLSTIDKNNIGRSNFMTLLCTIKCTYYVGVYELL